MTKNPQTYCILNACLTWKMTVLRATLEKNKRIVGFYGKIDKKQTFSGVIFKYKQKKYSTFGTFHKKNWQWCVIFGKMVSQFSGRVSKTWP